MSTTTIERIGGKGARLFGGATSAEALASSASVLRPTGHLAAKGLQQHYTPIEAAELAGRVLHAHATNVVDLTAGDGALMAAWPAGRRYGIEIDADQIACGDYHAIHGDLQRVYPLLRLARVTFPAVVLNPPFGLDWTDQAGKTINSTALAFRYGLGLLADSGQGVLVAGRDRFRRDVLTRPEGRGVYAVLECHGLFDGVTLACVVAFFCQPDAHEAHGPAPWQQVQRAELLETADWITAQRTERCRYLPMPWRPHTGGVDSQAELWKTIAAEHARRRRAAQQRAAASHDLTITGRRVRVALGSFALIALGQTRSLEAIRRLHGHSVSYFAYNAREWQRVLHAQADGILTVEPKLAAAVERVITDARRQLVPNYPIKPQQRLGYLDDLDSITCLVDDPERGFVAGERYPLAVKSKVKQEFGTKLYTGRDGDQHERRYRHERKLLQIDIGRHCFDEEPAEIAYILEHFDVPDPGDLAALYPDDVEAMRDVLRAIQADYGLNGVEGPLPDGRIRWAFKHFQIEDLARMLIKRRGLLSWEQGLGKTLGMMGLAVALERLGVQDAALFVVPQDLIPQWRDEAHRFFGRTLTLIESPAHARRVAKHVAAGGAGWFIVHMEGLSLTGKRDESLGAPKGARSRRHDRPMLIVHPSDYARLTPEQRARAIKHTDVTPAGSDNARHLTTAEACPSCLGVGGTAEQANAPATWNGRRCLACGYVHTRVRVHTAGHWLATAFRRGVIFVDEIQNAGGDSLRSDAVCGLQSDHKFGGTGTPIKNYVNDAFKPLWWSLGNASERFPYDFHGGRAAFERDFCVIEYLFGSGEHDSDRVTMRKVLPRVTNLSMLWRLLCGGMIRRRKEDTGEPLVPCTIHPIWVPAGTSQAAMNAAWADRFATMFAQRNPDHPLVEAGAVERFEAALGLLWKLEYASTLPAADPDLDWLIQHAANADERELLQRVSNWTPANLKALELAMRHARDGEKVVVFSDLIETGRWVCQQLQTRGVRAAHIVEDRDGKAATKNPRKRAQAIRDFRFGDTHVLCVGIKAVKQGHNLDTANTAIFVGQEWSHEAKAQAMARVHRLSSTKPVNIYVPMPTGPFLAAKKHELLNDKGASSDLALDGQLIEQDEREITWQQVIEQMKRHGITATGDEIPEATIKTTWDRAEGPFAPLAHPAITPPQPEVTAPLAPVIPLPRPALSLAAEGLQVELVEADSGQLALAI